MVEEVENFCAKLQAPAFVELDILEYGKVSVIKAWPDNHIASEVAEARNGSERRSVEPAIKASDNLDWPIHIGPDCVGDAVDRAAAGHDLFKGLPLCDWTMAANCQPSVIRLPLNGSS